MAVISYLSLLLTPLYSQKKKIKSFYKKEFLWFIKSKVHKQNIKKRKKKKMLIAVNSYKSNGNRENYWVKQGEKFL